MRARGHLTAVLVATTALGAGIVAGGCQGGGRNDELTRKEFVARANDICRRANETIGALPDPNLADPGAAPATIRRIVEIQRSEVEQLRELEPPKTDVPAIDEWLRFVGRALDQAERAVRALERDRRAELNDANAKGGDAQREADERARQYGATRCAVELEEPPTST